MTFFAVVPNRFYGMGYRYGGTIWYHAPSKIKCDNVAIPYGTIPQTAKISSHHEIH
jgi:hypothetical protein